MCAGQLNACTHIAALPMLHCLPAGTDTVGCACEHCCVVCSFLATWPLQCGFQQLLCHGAYEQGREGASKCFCCTAGIERGALHTLPGMDVQYGLCAFGAHVTCM